MGKDWDSLDGEAWRVGGGFSKPGIGDRPTAWASFGAADTANATCATCGGRMRGARKCECAEPDWRVKGKPLEAAGVDSRQAQGRKMQAWHETWATEALRVLKPGGHLLAFGGTRTYHRLACAIEDAGFEIRDCIAWLYGSGFPKSLDVSKAIDAAAGAARPVIERRQHRSAFNASGTHQAFEAETTAREVAFTAPATPDAERWQGWGTALKPAHEPVVVARKPLGGTVAANVLAHGTGAINVDGCRIGHDEPTKTTERSAPRYSGRTMANGKRGGEQSTVAGADPAGRWPANVVLDPEAARALDEMTGELTSSARGPNCGLAGGSKTDGIYSELPQRGYPEGTTYSDSGGASRFFYCAKSSSAERNAGLDGFEPNGDGAAIRPTRPICNVCGCKTIKRGPGPECPHDDWSYAASHMEERHKGALRNSHPTVKPIDLMRWLVRLVTPPGGLVLDPFAGSGTTGCAASLEGFRFVGIEREAEYAEIARARIAWWAEHPDGMELVQRLEHEKQRKAKADAGQLGLFG